MQYRFCEDFNANGTCDAGEIFRDWTESPNAVANPASPERLLMNARCSAAAPNGCTGAAQAFLDVVLPGFPAAAYLGTPAATSFSGNRFEVVGGVPNPNATQTCAGAGGVLKRDCFEWLPVTPSSRYDVADRLVPAATAGNTWTGAGGLFDTMSCAAASIACADSDGDGKCEFDTTGAGASQAGLLSIWLVREDTGSWNEVGSCTRVLDGPPPYPPPCHPYSRDTDMRTPVGPVCAPYPAP